MIFSENLYKIFRIKSTKTNDRNVGKIPKNKLKNLPQSNSSGNFRKFLRLNFEITNKFQKL